MRISNYVAPLIGCVVSVVSSLAYAEETSSHGHDKTSAGLPQLDPTHFSSQAFWMVLVFGVSYYVFSKKVLPKIESVLERRAGMIDADLTQAEQLNSQANQAKQHVEQTLRDARNAARHDIETAQAESIHIVGQRIDEIDRVLHVRIEQSEKSIEAAKNAALDEFQAFAGAVVQDVLAKVASLSLTEQQIAATIAGKSTQRERGRG